MREWNNSRHALAWRWNKSKHTLLWRERRRRGQTYGEQLLRNDKRRRRLLASRIINLLWIVIAVLVLFTDLGTMLSLPLLSIWALFSLGRVLWVPIGLGRIKTRQRILERRIAECEDVREIPALISVMRKSKPQYAVVRNALVRLFSQLEDGDQSLLSRRDHAWMHGKLWEINAEPGSADVALTLSILLALSEVGDVEALACVEALATACPIREIHEFAKELLSTLQTNIARRKDPLTLLRASHNHAVPAETLLRPAQEVAADQSDTLLRPR